MIIECDNYLKPKLFSLKKLKTVIPGYSDELYSKILIDALEIHVRATSNKTVERHIIEKKFNLTKKVFTSTYSINCCIEKEIDKIK